MKLITRTPPWKLTLIVLFVLVLWGFLLEAGAATAHAIPQRLLLPEALSVMQWVLGVCLAAICALGYTVYMNIINKLSQMERDQRVERILRRRYAAATLSILLMLNSDAFEAVLDKAQITERFRKVMENGDDQA